MKTIKLIILFVLFAGVFSACEPDNVINIDDVLGFARFEITTPDGSWDTSNGRTAESKLPCSFEEVTHMVYVLQKNGITFPTDPMTVTKIGSKIVSAKPVQLYGGDYIIKEFYLTDALGNALFVVPITGSEYATYVKDPLEIPFTVAKDDTKVIALEVVCLRSVGDDDPDPADFGYVTWEVYMVEVADFAAAVVTYSCDEGKFVFAEDAIFKIYNQEGTLIHELSQLDGTIAFEIAFKTRLGELIRIVVEAYEIDEVFTALELRDALDNNYGFIKTWQFGDAIDCLTPECQIVIVEDEPVTPDNSKVELVFRNKLNDNGTKKARLMVKNHMDSEQVVYITNASGFEKKFILSSGQVKWFTVSDEGVYKVKKSNGEYFEGSVTVDFESTEVETVERCDY